LLRVVFVARGGFLLKETLLAPDFLPRRGNSCAATDAVRRSVAGVCRRTRQITSQLPAGLRLGSQALLSNRRIPGEAVLRGGACRYQAGTHPADPVPSGEFSDFHQEQAVAKPNYHHARKQKEQARKSRQLKKEQRRTDRGKPGGGGTEDPVQPGSGGAGPPEVSSG
jgi:hypothetical protein